MKNTRLKITKNGKILYSYEQLAAYIQNNKQVVFIVDQLPNVKTVNHINQFTRANEHKEKQIKMEIVSRAKLCKLINKN